MIIGIFDEKDWESIDDIINDKKDACENTTDDTKTYENCTDGYSFKPHVHMSWPQDVIENMIADLEEDNDCDYCWQLDDICEKLYEEMGKTETDIERLMKSAGLSSVDAKCLEYNQGIMAGLFKALLLIRKYQDE